MKDVVSVFTKLSVPYFLSDGSLLHLYRNCSLGTSDLDFVVQLHWWNKSSSLRLQVALQDEGFRRQDFFGEQEMIGFQESWIRQEVKVRREKYTLLNMFCLWYQCFVHGLLQVDIFSGTFSLDQTRCYVVLWLTKFSFIKEPSVCSFPLKSIRKFFLQWGFLA